MIQMSFVSKGIFFTIVFPLGMAHFTFLGFCWKVKLSFETYPIIIPLNLSEIIKALLLELKPSDDFLLLCSVHFFVHTSNHGRKQ